MSALAKFLIVAVGYYLFGLFGLMLAIPPGFASAVWPAAGLALFCLLKCRCFAVLAGVGVGSFLMNLGVASGDFTNLTPGVMILPACIALGATAQAQLGKWFYDRVIGDGLSFDTPAKILRFILLVAPLGCLPGASVGAFTLYSLGFIGTDALGFTWLTWWIGDTIGVTLFTPLFATIFHGSAKGSRRRRFWVVFPTLLVFALILALFFTSMRVQKNLAEHQVRHAEEEFLSRIEKGLELSVTMMSSYSAYFAASEFVSPDEFALFSSGMFQHNNILQSAGWTRVVPDAEREQVEAQWREAGFSDFQFVELTEQGARVRAQPRSEYYPVLYIYPFDANQRAFGLDLGFNSARLTALRLARETGMPAATAPIKLAQEPGDERAFILYFPVFKPSPGGLRFHSYVSGVFRVNTLIQQMLSDAHTAGFAISVQDVTPDEMPQFLLESSDSAHALYEPLVKRILFGMRELEITLYPTEGYGRDDKDWQSWIVLTIGVLIATLLQSLILILTGQAAHIRHEVEIKTEALKKALTAAEQASIAKTNFLANMSHEIRTPLNAIIGLLRMCKQKNQQEEMATYLANADMASQTLLALINHTLDYNKIEAGKLELDTTEFEPVVILRKLNAIFSSQAQQQGIAFRIEPPELLPSKLIGDPLRLEQILLNLCANAFKFTPRGQVILQLHTRFCDAEKLGLEIRVQDTGVGIAKSQQAHLFQPFKQADSSTTRKFGGTGLGLAISRELVTLMGGQIDFDSSEGIGSEFRVTLEFPVVAGADMLTSAQMLALLQGAADAPRSAPRQESQTLPLTGRHLLVAEDIQVNQVIIQHMLEALGATITLVDNGRAAVERIQRGESFDLILMDIQMPEMDGYEATRQIRKLPNGAAIPIVAMTANAMATDIQACTEAGMNAHVGKPIDPEDLLAKILGLGKV